MKLLLDQNLPRKLVAELASRFPGSSHIRDFALEQATDRDIYDFAGQGGYCIVTKDVGFRDLVAVSGSPPKLVLVRFGNASNDLLHRRLLTRLDEIEDFGRSQSSTLELF